ncbi:RNA polymerase sigma factor [Mesobacillus foraminis]|uniref:RNA polymerase sigma factor n=1 Tax=Mesobacillus foraminis TaxID=279826 RepID=A0A4R2BMN8_9BACI|nr:RNA polymerase sigma factor [Mesobacillus foraminis]TCN27459.1 RNA polymerase sigma-70 factor (ECF subfamily) [Mesobacillus foraminis]
MSMNDLASLYRKFYPMIFKIGYAMTRDKYYAEDIVQDTFLKAIKKADTIKENEKVGAWLAVIARRTAIDFLRKEKNKPCMLIETEHLDWLGKETNQNVEEEVEAEFLTAEINEAIGKLSINYHDVMLLKMRYGFNDQEIADILELNFSTVKTRIFRARQKLKLMINEQVSA